jgi:hypothetical protein
MPRAPGAPPVRGGQMDPAALRSAEQTKMYQQQQAMLAKQEKGATQRAQIAAGAQMGSARIRAGAQAQAGAQATQRSAMEIEAQDRRAAERLRGQEEDRKFTLERDQRMEAANLEVVRLQDELSRAARQEDWDRFDKITEKALDASWNEEVLHGEYDAANVAASLDLVERMSQTETDREKARIRIERQNQAFDNQQGINAALREDIRVSLSGNVKFSPRGIRHDIIEAMGGRAMATAEQRETSIRQITNRALNEELSKLNMPNVTLPMLTDRGYPVLEELVGKGPEQGGLGFGELTKLYVLLDESINFMEDGLAEAEEKDEGLYRHFINRISNAKSVLDRLRTSNKEGVKNTAISAWKSYRKEGPKAQIKEATMRRGGDLLGMVEDRLEYFRSMDAGLFKGEYAGDYQLKMEQKIAQLEKLRKRLKKKKAGRQGREPYKGMKSID